MPIGSNSYGTTAKVAAYVPRYAPDGDFTFATRPTITQVEAWIDDVSAMVNVLLAELYFTVPVTQADCVSMLEGLVCSAVADKCEYANRSGRFWTESAVDKGISIEKTLRNEIADWITTHARGMVNLGADMTVSDVGASGAFSYTPKRVDGYSEENSNTS